MTAEIGRFALMLALMISAAQAILPMLGAHRRDARLMVFADSAAVAQFAFIALAFACLVRSFLASDFSLEVVAANSHTAKPFIYKFSGTWGNHEGSMMLWVLILSLFGATVGVFGRAIPLTLRARVLSIQGLTGLGFLAFIIATSDPFARLFPAPPQGAGLNPLLQDPGLASHPPFLYLGYVGFSTAFSFAIAALIEGRSDALWVRYARPWILAAWTCLTIGITLGSLWAYCVLGWGGWWFWDPVENASLMPWLFGTALVHCALIAERRQTLVKWTALLGILTFSMSLIGTFVVRSGVLTSVHAFAVDPGRGSFILALIVGFTGGGLILFGLRSHRLGEGAPFALLSREGSLVFNNFMLITLLATVFLGTFYPLAIDLLTHDKISVGPAYYNVTFMPLAALLMLGMVAGPLLKWREDSGREVLRRITPAAAAGGAVFIVVLAFNLGKGPWPAAGLGLAAWLIAGSLQIVTRRTRFRQVPLEQSLRMALAMPKSTYGVVAAHLGLGVLMAGVIGASTWKQEATFAMAPGEAKAFAGRQVRLLTVEPGRGPNFEIERAVLEFSRDGRPETVLSPERRFYPERQSTTTKAAIRTGALGNLYAALGDQGDDGRFTVRLYDHPLAPWIWFGGALMAIGGVLAFSGEWSLLAIRRRAPRVAPVTNAPAAASQGAAP
ncbi:MAG: heme lyase CcmF/NrfE family subunit [Proteobacteria bacterium]|nr:heme lyase CcmF/NrfE family subunit [Pseudomonadota bacterium]